MVVTKQKVVETYNCETKKSVIGAIKMYLSNGKDTYLKFLLNEGFLSVIKQTGAVVALRELLCSKD